MTRPVLRACVERLRTICQVAEDVEALDLLDQMTNETCVSHGGDRRSDTFKGDNVTLENTALHLESGNTATYALRRLRKDRPDLHTRVLAKELSPHAKRCWYGRRRKVRATELQ